VSDPIRVLLVEDSATDAKLVLHALQQGGAAVHSARVQDESAMRAALEAGTWDVIVSDWSMPKFSGLQALALIKDMGVDVPFILVSGTIGEESAVEAMRAGAKDYVLKDKLARLAPAVERELREAKERAARRQAEKALRMQALRFRAIIEHSQDGIVLTSREGKTLYMSPAARRIVNAPAGDDVNAFAFIHPDDRARVADFRAKLMAQPNASAAIELRALLPDGSIRWLETFGTNLLDEQTIQAIVGNFRDVTERKLALDALRASEARFARLSESGIIGIAFADIHGHVHDANDAYLQMLGYSRKDVVSGIAGWTDITPPEWREVDARAMEQLKTQGVAPAWEKEMLRTDGSRVPVLVGVAMLDHSNCIAFVADLTARKQAEAALRRTEEQLRQSQKMQAIGVLAGGVAHDFNNVLSVILGFSEIVLQDLRETDPMRADVHEIRQAGQRAAALTRQLLAFSRQQVIDPKVLDLNGIIKNMDKMLRRIIREDVELTTIPFVGLGRCKSDAGQIEQIVMNLVVNARDAMPDGGRLTIETGNVELDEEYARTHLGVTPGQYVMLAVSDTGTGMDKATQTRIFEPFFTTKEKGKGTGLGLSTVFGIVEQSGGSVWVYSELGTGTTFKVYLPATEDAAEDVTATTAATTLRGNETILLVEDEDQIRHVAKEILQRHGYRVIECRNGGEALLTCEQYIGTIDLLLSDVVMPQMNGKQLADRLASLRPDLKKVFMSGYADGALVGALAVGSAFLQKPLTPATLLRKVRHVLDAPGAHPKI
jgi:two-component system, cell cycle sensor histidine kinase and response regulator CckA